MPGDLHYTLRNFMIDAIAGRTTDYEFAPNYEVSLLSAGTEISGNGYDRAGACVGNAYAADGWSRSGTVATVTTLTPHNLVVGDVVTVTVCDDVAAITLGDKTVTAVTATTFTFDCLNAGATSGELTMEPPAFWGGYDDGDGTRNLVSARDIVFPAASGASWSFDELRLHSYGASGGYLFRFTATAPIAVADGDTLTIAAGSLSVNDLSLTLA